MTDTEELLTARHDVINGVPVFFADSAERRVTAALVFRVGWTDEAIPQRGLTHLVEHLSLMPLGQQAYDFNGMVEETRTSFFCSGTIEQVTAFLNSLCRTISALPLDRLESEKRILSVEADSRRQSAIDALRIWRFGTHGPGAGSYDEFALHWVGPEQVRAWAARWFTSGNAALWITCPPPPGLDLTLPSGPRCPARRPVVTELRVPSHITGPGDGLAASLIVPRCMDSAALDWLLQRRLFARLRMQDAVSYSVSVARRAIDDLTNELFILVDGLPAAQARLETGVLDVLDDLREHGCTEAELSEWRDRYLRPLGEREAAPALLNQAATDHLLGQPVKQSADLVAEADRVTPDSVRQLLAACHSQILFCVPASSPVVSRRTPSLPEWSARAVDGRRFRSTNPNSANVLVVGEQGISFVVDADRRATVRWDECAAVLRWDDGGRRILGTDGTWLDLPPQAWREFPALQTAIDAHTQPGQVVEMGAAPPRPPAPLPRAMVLGAASTSVVVALAVALALSGGLLALSGLKPFLVGGLPSLAAAAWCGREVYLRKTGIHGEPAAPEPRESRSLRHVPQRHLWLMVALSLMATVGLGVAAAMGAPVGLSPLVLLMTTLSVGRELGRRQRRR